MYSHIKNLQPIASWRIWSAVGLVLSFSILRGINMPIDWVYVHWLMNYDYGFIKRGLVGSVVKALGFYNNPAIARTFIDIFSMIIYGLLLLSFILVGYRILSLTRHKAPAVMTVILFFSSGFLVMTGNLIGYFDHLWQIVTILCLMLIFKRQMLLAAVIQIPLILIHESYLVVGFPVIVLSLVLVGYQKYGFAINRQYVAQASLVVAMPLLTFGTLSLVQETRDTELFRQDITSYLTSYGYFEPHHLEDVIEAYLYRFSDYLREQSPQFIIRLTVIQCWLNTLPVLFFAVYYLHRTFRPSFNILIKVLVVLTLIAPLSLHLIAWDYSRIWMYPIFHAFLVVWIFTELYPAQNTSHFRVLYGAFLMSFLITLLIPIVPQTLAFERLSILPLRLGIMVLTCAVLFAPLPARIRQNTKASLLETPCMQHDPAQD